MRLAIIGANGQLGTDLMRRLAGTDAVPLTHADLDIADSEAVERVLLPLECDTVINLAAYHRVDDCEAPANAELAFRVNALGVRNLARHCQRTGSTLVHFSTDYVFDGRAGRPYVEADMPRPLSVYGTSKAAGEQFVQAICERYYLIRTTGLYGIVGSSGKGGNFVETMVRMGREGRPLRVVNDQVMSPTATDDLAGKVLELLQTGRFGLYHVTNGGWCSWYEFARTIFEMLGIAADLQPTDSNAFGAAAQRPAFSALESRQLVEAGLAPLRPWSKALAVYLEARASRTIR